MYSIDNNIIHEYVVNKSKFITRIFYIEDDNIEPYIRLVKNEFKDADHYCYAYIVNEKFKASDDKEPSGTAGIPILNVLKNNNLNNILCIVIRYFGGIKLGSGGLVRAYTKSVSKALENNIIKYNPAYKIKISFNYNDINNIDFLLKDCDITYKEFKEKIVYKLIIEKELFYKIKNNFQNLEVIEECYIKKK